MSNLDFVPTKHWKACENVEFCACKSGAVCGQSRRFPLLTSRDNISDSSNRPYVDERGDFAESTVAQKVLVHPARWLSAFNDLLRIFFLAGV